MSASEKIIKTIGDAGISVENYANKHPPSRNCYHKRKLVRDCMFSFVSNPKTVVEVGSRWGHWALRAATHLPDDSKIYCVDPWLETHEKWGYGDEDVKDWADNVKPFLGGKVVGLRGTSRDFASMFDPLSVDLCFIDGDHSEEAVYDDCSFWWPRIKPGGVLVGHDILSREYKVGVKSAVDSYFGEDGYSVEACYKVPEGAEKTRALNMCWVVRKS